MVTFAQVVQLLGAKKASDAQYSARCPAHADDNPSLSIGRGKRGEILLHCHAGCPYEEIKSAIQRKVLAIGLTLSEYATMKALPIEYLQSQWNLEDITTNGRSAISIPYLDGGSSVVRRKFRLSRDSHDSHWDHGTATLPYGLWRVHGPCDVLFLVEGESDAQTMAFYELPVLGISGANGWNTDFTHLDPIKLARKIILVPDQDSAGRAFVKKIARDLPAEKLAVVRLAAKDVSQMHLEDPLGFKAKWDLALECAVPVDLYLDEASDDRSEKTETLPLTDLGNAERFVRDHGQDFRYCTVTKKSLFWTGTNWQVDVTGESVRKAKKTVRNMLVEAGAVKEENLRKAFVKHQIRSESENRIKAMVSLAQSEKPIAIEITEFDRDPMLLNLRNGTFDLRSGILREHSRPDLITKICPVDYISGAEAPEWCRFIDRVTGYSPALADYLRRVIGYALTGDTSEHVLFLLHGNGANGKSTFLETVRYLLGDYARTADFESFLASKASGIRNDIARLNGARFVTASESEQGKRMAESIVKQITGGDRVSARFLYGEYFEFLPQFKLFLGTNHRPKIVNNDDGMWRRIRLIPFTVTIPPVDRDHKLAAKLQSEASGILNWALVGLREWLEKGLDEPQEILAATDDYRQREDAIGHFVTERCHKSAAARVGSNELYAQYSLWASLNNEFALNHREFAKALEQRGLQRKHTNEGTVWFGIDCTKPFRLI